jgi:hypothetical protein
VLGLRDLQSFGLMPVKKPFIKFNLKSLLPPEQSKAITDVQTNPGDTGANPNINTSISFTMQLPHDSLFCPKLTCYVYDYVFKGLSQPLLGTFQINLGHILDETRQFEMEELEESSNIIKGLQAELEGRSSSPMAVPINSSEIVMKIDEDIEALKKKLQAS